MWAALLAAVTALVPVLVRWLERKVLYEAPTPEPLREAEAIREEAIRAIQTQDVESMRVAWGAHDHLLVRRLPEAALRVGLPDSDRQ